MVGCKGKFPGPSVSLLSSDPRIRDGVRLAVSHRPVHQRHVSNNEPDGGLLNEQAAAAAAADAVAATTTAAAAAADASVKNVLTSLELHAMVSCDCTRQPVVQPVI